MVVASLTPRRTAARTPKVLLSDLIEHDDFFRRATAFAEVVTQLVVIDLVTVSARQGVVR